MDKFELAVIIPCYNEAQTIGKVIQDFKHYLPQAIIYVYDNNSSDETAQVATKHGAVVRFEGLRGKGRAIRRALNDVQADIYIMIDGDDTYEVSQASLLVEHLLMNHLDMVSAARMPSSKSSHRFGHRFGNWLFNKIILWLFEVEFKDIFSGYRVFTKRFAKTFPCSAPGFELETEMNLHALAMHMAVAELPSPYHPRPPGSSSKLNTIHDGARIVIKIFKLVCDYRPFALFSLIAVSFLSVATFFFHPIWVTFLQTGLVPKLPTLVVVAACFIISCLFFLTGIVLHAITVNKLEMRRLNYLDAT